MSTIAEPPFRSSRYTTGAIVLHWTIALLVLLQIGSGWAMTDLLAPGSSAQYTLFQLHKSVGISVLVLTVARVLWRLFNPPPPEPASVARWESALAGLVHKVFYVLLLVVPLAGWLLVSVARVRIPTDLFFVLPWPHLPGFGSLTSGNRLAWEFGASEVHALLAWTLGVLVALHVAGAVRHHLADGVFISRMSTRAKGDGPRNSYGHATTFLVTLAFVLTMVAAATIARRAPNVAEVAGAVSPDAASVLGTTSAIAPGDLTVEAAASQAASVQPANAATAPAAASAWRVVDEGSSLSFGFDYAGAPLAGTFPAFDAEISFDPQNLAGSRIAATIDLTEATVAGTDITPPQLRGPDGFAAAPDAPARFLAETVRAEGAGYVADGTLTLRGVTVPLRLDFTVVIDGARATAAGTATVDRMAFGIGRQSDPDGRTVSLGVTVRVALVAERT